MIALETSLQKSIVVFGVVLQKTTYQEIYRTVVSARLDIWGRSLQIYPWIWKGKQGCYPQTILSLGTLQVPIVDPYPSLPNEKNADLTWPEQCPRWLQKIRQESRGFEVCSFFFHGWPPELRKTAPLLVMDIMVPLIAKGCADLCVLTWCAPAKSRFVIVQSAVTRKKLSAKRQESVVWQPQKRIKKIEKISDHYSNQRLLVYCFWWLL
jgi:hypothetical protein